MGKFSYDKRQGVFDAARVLARTLKSQAMNNRISCQICDKKLDKPRIVNGLIPRAAVDDSLNIVEGYASTSANTELCTTTICIAKDRSSLAGSLRPLDYVEIP